MNVTIFLLQICSGSAYKGKVLKISVVALGGAVVFMVLPAVIFTFTEDWNIGEGIYYSFITLTTIGFGDYVAGGIPWNRGHLYERLRLLNNKMIGLAMQSAAI